MIVYLLLICLELFICFGGIYHRKITAGILGLFMGILVYAIVHAIIYTGGGVSYAPNSVPVMEIVANIAGIAAVLIVIALLVCLDKFCAVLSTFFFSSMILFVITVQLHDYIYTVISFDWILLGDFIIAVVLAVVAFKYYNYAFVLVTAFSGAFHAGLIAYTAVMEGIIYREWVEENPEYSAVFEIFDGRDLTGFFVVMTIMIILGCIGCFVQMRRLKQISNPERKDDDAGSSFR